MELHGTYPSVIRLLSLSRVSLRLVHVVVCVPRLLKLSRSSWMLVVSDVLRLLCISVWEVSCWHVFKLTDSSLGCLVYWWTYQSHLKFLSQCFLFLMFYFDFFLRVSISLLTFPTWTCVLSSFSPGTLKLIIVCLFFSFLSGDSKIQKPVPYLSLVLMHALPLQTVFSCLFMCPSFCWLYREWGQRYEAVSVGLFIMWPREVLFKNWPLVTTYQGLFLSFSFLCTLLSTRVLRALSDSRRWNGFTSSSPLLPFGISVLLVVVEVSSFRHITFAGSGLWF